MRKILIAVPCMDMVSARFAQSLTTLKKVDHTVVSFLIGSLIYDARNRLAGYSIQMEADYVLWLDSDMVFQPDILERMLKTMEEHEEIDVLSGLYFRRAAPFTPVLFEKLELVDGVVKFKDAKEVPDELFEIPGCGFGCVLMKTECLLGIGGKTGSGNWFTPHANCGEDVAFCLRARDAGYRIFCDPKIELGHMGFAPVTRSLYEAVKGEDNGTT